MMKDSTLIRNKGSVIYYHNWGLLEFGGTQNFGDNKGRTQKFFLLKGGTEDFHKKGFQVLSFTCIKTCSKTLLPEHLDHHEKFSCHFAAKNSQYFL